LLQQQLATKDYVAAKKILYAGPKHFDKLKPQPDLTRKARPDLQLWAAPSDFLLPVYFKIWC